MKFNVIVCKNFESCVTLETVLKISNSEFPSFGGVGFENKIFKSRGGYQSA